MRKYLKSNSKYRQSDECSDSKEAACDHRISKRRFSERERQAALASLYCNSDMNDRVIGPVPKEEKRVFGAFDRDYFDVWNPDDTADLQHVDLERIYEQSDWAEHDINTDGLDHLSDSNRWRIDRLPDDEEEADEEKASRAVADTSSEEKGAPEWYEWYMPDGFDTLDRALLEDFEPVARALNLTNAQANRLVSLYTDRILPMLISRDRDDRLAEYAAWEAAVRDDPDIGKERLEHNLALARLAIARYGSDELRSVLNESGLGNHPAMVRFLVQLARQLGMSPDVSTSLNPVAPSIPL